MDAAGHVPCSQGLESAAAGYGTVTMGHHGWRGVAEILALFVSMGFVGIAVCVVLAWIKRKMCGDGSEHAP